MTLNFGNQWKTLDRHEVLRMGKYLTVEKHAVELPDGRVIEDWPWVVTPDYINVVVVTQEERYLFFRQTKYAIEGTSLAPVGGYMEPGEEPLSAAERELLEETGYRSQRWTSLGSFRVDGNRGAGTAHLFLARDAFLTAQPNSDDLEEQEMVFLSRPETESALTEGEFKILAWATNVALALECLRRGD